MAFCQNCGTKIDDSAAFCRNCGARTQPQAQQNGDNIYTQPVQPQAPVYASVNNEAYNRGSGVLNTGMLVFSIIVTVLGNWILGIIALVFTILAKDEKTAEGEKEKLKVAKTLNIISAVLVGLAVLMVILFVILTIVLGAGVVNSIFTDYVFTDSVFTACLSVMS